MIRSTAIGTPVRFRETFGEVGSARIEFTINGEPFWENTINRPRRQVVSLKYVVRTKGCSKTRLGYVDDLIDA